MDNVSVSKGVFAYKGKYKIGQKRKDKTKSAFSDELWYSAYKETWSIVQNAAEAINSNMFKQILTDLQSYVSAVKNSSINNLTDEISTAILLTGVNLPDHTVLFQKICNKIEKVTPYVATVWSRDSINVKNIIEEIVHKLINSDVTEDSQVNLRKSQCTMHVLSAWHKETVEDGIPLVIIFPDFESFSSNILRDVLLILSSYTNAIKFVVIFGVATTLHAVHRSLSYDVTSKLRVKVFHTQTQIKSLSDVLEGTVFSTQVPFKLTGKAFQLLADIFLFYDFSVGSFLQSYKLCMMQHFYGNNIATLCCKREVLKDRMSFLTVEDIQELKTVPSIVAYFDKSPKYDLAGIDDKEFKKILEKVLNEFHDQTNAFLVILRCLHFLSFTLPGAPLGKQLREVYIKAVLSNIVESVEYKESIQLLSFLSKDELLGKLDFVLTIIEESNEVLLENVKKNLKNHVRAIEEASLDVISSTTSEVVSTNEKLSRVQFKERLKKNSHKQTRSQYKQAQLDLMEYLDRKVFTVYLRNPTKLTAHEIFCFSDGNLAKHHIRGSLRAAIHMALNNPQVYLQCECCKLETEDSIRVTLPDLSIIYKLHLESRKLINMYDWLQAFLTIINPSEEDEEEVDPKLQARFTRSVAELQFLGFIKSSRKKMDHVKRLTC